MSTPLASIFKLWLLGFVACPDFALTAPEVLVSFLLTAARFALASEIANPETRQIAQANVRITIVARTFP